MSQRGSTRRNWSLVDAHRPTRPSRRFEMTASVIRTFSTCMAALFVTTMLVTVATSTALIV